MPRDCNIFSYISNEVPKVVLHLLAIPHQSLLCKVIVLTRGALCELLLTKPRWELKWAQGTRLSPWLAARICDFCSYLSPCALQFDILFLYPVFPLSRPSKMVFPACSLFLLYHHKVGKAELSKTGDGNFPGKGWRGTKRRQPAWTERHSTGDGLIALGIYTHL